VPVHFSADPSKGAAWVATQKARFREEIWRQEMGIDFGRLATAPAYYAFRRELHVTDESLLVNVHWPLLLSLDFNIEPMSMVVAQIAGGVVNVVGEIVLSPGTIEATLREFRNRHPFHRAGLQIYGDAAGHGRSHQSGRSSWDLVRLGLQGYAGNVNYKVPKQNPGVLDRLNAVNLKLMPPSGTPGIRISPTCVELIKDFQEVRMTPDGKEIAKTYKSEDPYSRRTHVSDALGYLIAAEFSTASEVWKAQPSKPRPPLVYAPGALLGSFPRR
jgi:hypothetical protein